MLYERTLGQWLEHWAETTPDKEYIVYSDRNLRFTWSQFNRRNNMDTIFDMLLRRMICQKKTD